MGSCGHQSLSDDSLGWPPGARLGSHPGLEGTVLPAKLGGTSEVLLFSRRPPGRTVMARPAQGGQGSEKLGLSMGEGSAPDLVRMRLRPGSTAIIASDGVIADSEDEWVKELLNRGFDDMKSLARSTLKEAEKLYGSNDDMTVVTVRVEERP